ncbi:TetR/AcrR family transcriptional regulator [Nocardia sp. NPDC004068]|uniref:TetR/AcrR family transcriptional regulator n=1 Tax=Nocardia sp. NPDC004068 TaxID=3364303 RepID=UPI0036D028E9
MTTASKTPASRADIADEVEERILDAALSRFQEVGVKKTTIEDVARHAGVDRVTVYRRLGSRDDLVAAVVRREVGAVLAEIAGIPERHDTLDGLVADIFVTVVTRWRAHPLVRRMLDIEPERVIMNLTVAGANVFAMSVATAAAALEQAVDRGLLAPVPDLTGRCEVICRVVHSLILTPQGALDLATEERLADFARRYLVPIVVAP